MALLRRRHNLLPKHSSMRKITLLDLAQMTGFSVTTISRVLNGKTESHRISKASEEIILEAVRKSGYKPNLVAQSLRNHSTHTIGLLVPHIENPFFANIAGVVIREAHKYTYPVMLIDTLESQMVESQAIDTLLSRNVDGIIMVPVGGDTDRLTEIYNEKPIVLIDRYYENHVIPYVATDNYRGAYDATRLLIDSGHRNIMCIQGNPQSITSKERVRGYSDALVDAGFENRVHVCGNEFSTQNGYVETKLALHNSPGISAIFALSSTILLGSIKAIYEHGIKIPDDISIISFDNNNFLDFMNPSVTTVAQPLEHIGIMAVKMLMDRILDNVDTNTSILLQPEIIRRNSIRNILQQQ